MIATEIRHAHLFCGLGGPLPYPQQRAPRIKEEASGAADA